MARRPIVSAHIGHEHPRFSAGFGDLTPCRGADSDHAARSPPTSSPSRVTTSRNTPCIGGDGGPKLTTIGSVAGFELRHGVPELLANAGDLRKGTQWFSRLIHVPVLAEALMRLFFAEVCAAGPVPAPPPAELADRCQRLAAAATAPGCWRPTPPCLNGALDRTPAATGCRCRSAWPLRRSAAAWWPPISRRSHRPGRCGACWPDLGVSRSTAGSKPQPGVQLPRDGPLRHAHGSQSGETAAELN